MDKEWMKLARDSPEYINGVEFFLNYAYSKGKPQGKEILCPCIECHNARWKIRAVVFNHLIYYGFEKGYDVWIRHGEGQINPVGLDGDTDEEEDRIDDIDGLLYERFRDVAEEEYEVNEGLGDDAKKFYDLLEDAKQELYPGCKNFSKLSFTIRLYLLKCLYGWSNVSFNALLELLREAMPQLNIPDTLNKTKGMIRDLGLDYKKIDACPKDCMLYWKDHENDTSCYVCGEQRWVDNAQGDYEVEENNRVHKVPRKILRHFPLIPRLQRLFMCSKTACSLRWHEEERSKDGKLRHPADGEAWKDFDKRHVDFAADSRNIRLGLASDGFNPFRSMNVSHSTWPVVLIPYNFPPWWCMKAEYSMLSLLIPGPFSPGNDIDVYLQPLIEELKVLWELGVETYDASLNQTFQMRAALLWTISDFPGYAMLSGWSTKGKLACPCCNYNTNSTYLKHSRKMCYMGHRIFLPMDHKYRSNARAFNGSTEYRPPPDLLEGEDILELLKDFINVFGKKEKKNSDGPWKKRSIFFELPYWKHNALRHNLDVMHIEKNIFDNIIGTLLDMPGKTKDHEKARFDLQDMGIRKKLHPKETNQGAASKRKRGKTLCVKIHTRSPDDREEIILNEEGQPIGPNERIVSQFSSFLGTIARSSDLCPLIYTNWKAIPEKDKNIWGYVNKKYIVSEKGKKAVYAIINDAWRRYKCSIKKKHFSKYKNLRERLKNRPEDIPEEHFRKLMEYWRIEAIQEISVQNAQNIAQQKWRHRAGPISFARIRERMCASKEDGESPSQAEMFIETRQSKKGKELDTETSDAIIKLQDLVSLGQSSSEAFQNVLGKEKPGRVRCHGRTTTATILKKNEEIAEIKRAYANEVEQLKEAHACEMRELKDQNQKFQQGMEDKFQLLIKAMLNQSNSRPNLEALVALLSTPPDANSALRSSTSTHAPNNHEEPDDDMDDGHLLDGHLLDDLEVEVDEDLS